MKRNFKKFGLIILAFLLSSGIMYSQTNLWEPASTPLSNNSLPMSLKYVWSIAIANNDDVWASTPEGLFLSTNNGDTWSQKNNGLPVGDLTIDGVTFKYLSFIDVITINSMDGSIFAGGQRGLFISTDYGDSWTTIIDLQGKTTTVNDILFTPSGEIYAAIPGDAIILYSKDNGNSWIPKNNGLSARVGYVRSLALGTDGILYASTTCFGVCRSTDGGDNWLPSSNYTDASIYGFTIFSDGSIFTAAGFGGVLKSIDKGVTWEQLSTGLNIGVGNDNTYLGSVQQIVYNPLNGHMFVTDIQNGVYKSTDLGGNWYKTGNGLPEHTFANNSLAVNHRTGMLFVSYSTVNENTHALYRFTPDNGSEDNDSKIDINVEPQSIDFGAVQFGSYIDTVIYITNKGTTDLFINSINIMGDDASSFSNTFNNAITLKPNEEQKLSVRFTPKTEGTKNATQEIVTDIGSICISLNGNSIAQDNPMDILTEYSLMQNYPNPFNPTTTIQYAIPKDEFVKLTVYDITGKVVKELVNGNKPAGRYSIEFNASSYSSGTYYYKIEAGEYKNIQKMMLVK